MKNFKSHFWYTKSQRNGIFFLALVIIALQCIYFFVDFGSDQEMQLDKNELQAFQSEIDSLKKSEQEKKKPKLRPFNPSFITDFKGYQLGMSIEEIDRLLAHRAAGNYINSVEEFQQVTNVSDRWLDSISPYFKFPDWVLEKQRKSRKEKTLVASTKLAQRGSIRDLNLASAQDLTSINGVGVTLAHRIVNYRNKLHGFVQNEQLYEVYHLDSTIVHQILEHFAVITKPTIKKINVNEASFKQVLSIVYIDYDLTKKIFQYRDEVAEIQTLEELKKIEGFPLEKYDRIAVYLGVK